MREKVQKTKIERRPIEKASLLECGKDLDGAVAVTNS